MHPLVSGARLLCASRLLMRLPDCNCPVLTATAALQAPGPPGLLLTSGVDCSCACPWPCFRASRSRSEPSYRTPADQSFSVLGGNHAKLLTIQAGVHSAAPVATTRLLP